MTISRIKKSTTQSAAVISGVKNENGLALVGVEVGDEDASEAVEEEREEEEEE